MGTGTRIRIRDSQKRLLMQDDIGRDILRMRFFPPPRNQPLHQFGVSVIRIEIPAILRLTFPLGLRFLQKSHRSELPKGIDVKSFLTDFPKSVPVDLPLGQQVGSQIPDAFPDFGIIDFDRQEGVEAKTVHAGKEECTGLGDTLLRQGWILSSIS